MGVRIDRGAGTQRTRRARATRDAGRALATLTLVSTDGTALPTLASASDTAEALAQAVRRTGKLVAKLRGRGTSSAAGDPVAEADAPPAAPAPVQTPSPAAQGRQFGLTAGIQGTAAVLLDDPTPEAETFNEAAVDGFALGAKVRIDRLVTDAAAAHPADPEAFEDTARQALAREVEQVDPRFGLVLETLYENRIERVGSGLEAERQTQEQELLVATLQQSFRDDFDMARQAARAAHFDEMESRSTQAVAAIRQLQELRAMPDDEAGQRIQSLRVITRNETVSGLFDDALQDSESAAQAFIDDFRNGPQEGFTPEQQEEFAGMLVARRDDHRQTTAIEQLAVEGERTQARDQRVQGLLRRAESGDVAVREETDVLMRQGVLNLSEVGGITGELKRGLARKVSDAQRLEDARDRYYNALRSSEEGPLDQLEADLVFEEDFLPIIRRARTEGSIAGAAVVTVSQVRRTGVLFGSIAEAVSERFDQSTNVDDLEFAVGVVLGLQDQPETARLLDGLPRANAAFVERVRFFQNVGIHDLREAVEKAHVESSPIGAVARQSYQKDYDDERSAMQQANAAHLRRAVGDKILANAVRVNPSLFEQEVDVARREIGPGYEKLVEHFFVATRGNLPLAQNIADRYMFREFRPTTVGIGPLRDFHTDGSALRRRPLEYELKEMSYGQLSLEKAEAFVGERLKEGVAENLRAANRHAAAAALQDRDIEAQYIPRSEHRPEGDGLPAYRVFYYDKGDPDLLNFEFHISRDDVLAEIQRLQTEAAGQSDAGSASSNAPN